jgi:hypothetical protein
MLGLAVVGLLALAAAPAQAHWPNTNATKFVQLPDTTTGIDVDASGSLWVADDFVCTNTGPVQDIHLWCSWLNDAMDPATIFNLVIWSDVPVSATNGFSHPGIPLWTGTFGPGQYEMVPVQTSPIAERFLYPGQGLIGQDFTIWQCNFYPANQFVQTGGITAPIIYWLSVNATPQSTAIFGWKTSTNHFNDYAVFGPTGPGNWQKITGPAGTFWNLDLAFSITTLTNSCPPPPPYPPPPPVETNTVKFVMPPDLNGYDVKACAGIALADDFACTNTGPISDIHLWCSWLGDQWATNVPIWLGIYSDVPAGPIPSHPGTLLWSQTFAPGQYQPYLAATGKEGFYDPSLTSLMGTDSIAFYYSFYPTNPFVQTGSSSNPTNYWLAVYAPVTNVCNVFGWKTAVTHYNDWAVWGNWGPNGPPTGWTPLLGPTGTGLDLAFKITTLTNPCPPPPPYPPQPPPETNVIKFVMPPNFIGYDVLDSGGITLADDFLCTNTGPVTDIHLWCSWMSDQWTTDVPIWLGIYSDVPAGATPSHPGTLLWSQTFAPGQYQPYLGGTGHEGFYDPRLTGLMGTDSIAFYYSFYPTNPFVQSGTSGNPTNYWLAVYAPITNTCNVFGWKTAVAHYNDLAVWGHWGGNVPAGDWQQLIGPTGGGLDLAFKLTALTNPPPAPLYSNKFTQFPDLSTNGLDVRLTTPKILADDFMCTNTGPITNIQVWCSWLNDNVDPNARFLLGIWSDVPGGGTTPSHPGTLYWQSWFSTGSYTAQRYATSSEKFYDPNIAGTNDLIGADQQILQYSFSPSISFWQTGTVTKPTIYWLSVSAASASSTLVGWKTSTNKFQDDAVYGHVTAGWQPLQDWQELRDPRNGNSLNLSFEINSGQSNPPPPVVTKFLQPPDLTTNGLDVRAASPKILADDFKCIRPVPIRGVTVWGSWLNDLVDTNAQFMLGLWTDVPATNSGLVVIPSHPGVLITNTWFYPPQSTNQSLLRYRYQLVAQTSENFFDPNANQIIGPDTQVWRYDFFPWFWKEYGLPYAPRTYWLSVMAKTNSNNFLFGWKTSANRWGDDAVFGHVNVNGQPLNDWQELRDPRGTNSLNLAFAIRNYNVYHLNKDFMNLNAVVADTFEIVLAGVHDVTWHFDDGLWSPVWPGFTVVYSGGNTTLRWSGQPVAPLKVTHVGFEVPYIQPVQIVAIRWLAAGAILGPPAQINIVRTATAVQFLNNVLDPPALVRLGNFSIEYRADAVPLDQLNPSAARTPPLRTDLIIPTGTEVPIPPGGTQSFNIPPPPPEATYAVHIFQNTTNLSLTEPGATTDFVQLPLDTADPPVITSVGVVATGNVTISWTSLAGRTYRLQTKATVNGPSWTDLADIPADTDITTAVVAVGSATQFYRVALLPVLP